MSAGCRPRVGKEERWKRKRPVPQRTSLQTQTHGTTFAGPPERPHSYESANTPSALNAGTRSGYLGRSPFPLSLSDPFAGEPSAGFQLPPLSVGVPPGLIFASKVCFICGKNTTGETALSIPPECFSIVFYNRAAGRTPSGPAGTGFTSGEAAEGAERHPGIGQENGKSI